MILVLLGLVSLVVLARVVHLVLADDPTRHRPSYRPPASHHDDGFAPDRHRAA